VRDYRNLVAWQVAHDLALLAYRMTASFPADERFALTSQTRRSASSVPANIAEGSGRFSQREFRRLLSIAAGSASELQYHLELARDLGYAGADSQAAYEQAHRVRRLLWGLCRATTV